MDQEGFPSNWGNGKWKPGGPGRPPRWWQDLETVLPLVDVLKRFSDTELISILQRQLDGIEENNRDKNSQRIFGWLSDVLNLKLNAQDEEMMISVIASMLGPVLSSAAPVIGIITALIIVWKMEEKGIMKPPILHNISGVLLSFFAFGQGFASSDRYKELESEAKSKLKENPALAVSPILLVAILVFDKIKEGGVSW